MNVESKIDRRLVVGQFSLPPVLGLLILLLFTMVVVSCGRGAGDAGDDRSEAGGGGVDTASNVSPVPLPETAQPAVPTKPPPDLPPVREGFQPAREDFAVMGDPGAPVTVVEYSDYQ